MNKPAHAASPLVDLATGVSAVTPGLAWLHGSRAIVAADVHLGYEDVIGGALPVWSTREITRTLLIAARRMNAREIVLLGDVIHGSRMSEGAARAVREALDAMRAAATLTLVAGNHEGHTRGRALLGETVEHALRDGWMLVHGDRPARYERTMIGHLHPSLHVGGGQSVPAFLACSSLVAVPALTPYSPGLNVFSRECLHALRAFGPVRELQVVAAAGDMLYPFGSLAQLQKWLRPDGYIRARGS